MYIFDYRQFFTDNSIFNGAIDSSSLIFANTMYDNWGFSYKTGNSGEITDITELLELHGFQDVVDYKLEDDYSDDDISEVGIGFHNVTYMGSTLTVVAVIIRGTNGTIEEWSSNVDIGDPDTWTSDNHKGFYTTEQRIKKYLTEYLSSNKNLLEDQRVYWVTGHSRGAALANLLSAELIDEGKTVYGYTFASPGTTVSASKNAEKYDSIFNIKNNSDVVTYVPLSQWGFGTYGITINVDISRGFEQEWCTQTGRSHYNAFSSIQLNAATKILYNDCASSWEAAYEYSGAQNITDEQYLMISERAKRYCKLEKRTSLRGNDKGYKLYPSTMFMLQLGMEIYAGTETEKSNACKLKNEFWNSKYMAAGVVLLGTVWLTGLPSDLDASVVGDGHSPSTYYVLVSPLINQKLVKRN
jgi:hypothetical protein